MWLFNVQNSSLFGFPPALFNFLGDKFCGNFFKQCMNIILWIMIWQNPTSCRQAFRSLLNIYDGASSSNSFTIFAKKVSPLPSFYICFYICYKCFCRLKVSEAVALRCSKKFAKFTRKHLSQVNKKEALAQVFCCEFCEMFRTTFFYRTPLVAAS